MSFDLLRSAPTENQLLGWLKETDVSRLGELFAAADVIRRETVGDAVHFRGLIEISNHCVRQCAYCGLRAGRSGLNRYRMSDDEIVATAKQAVKFGYGTVVLQAGEDPGIGAAWMADVIRRIKTETPLAVTLSLGEREEAELTLWKQAGADRYLLRFETSDIALFQRIHPSRNGKNWDRIVMLWQLRQLGYEVGSGVMVGLPGQTYRSLAQDILKFRKLDLDMIGIGPFIPHPETPLGMEAAKDFSVADQAPNTEAMLYRVLALTRLVCPEANIPSTTALATINKRNGRELGLQRGANVVMPNLTPVRYRALYEIYPAKACVDETGDACNNCLRLRLAAIGRHSGSGPGGRNRSASSFDRTAQNQIKRKYA